MIILDDMIKRVIFDIDNTLIPWKNEYYNEYCELDTEEGQKQIKYYTVSKIDEILNIL